MRRQRWSWLAVMLVVASLPHSAHAAPPGAGGALPSSAVALLPEGLKHETYRLWGGRAPGAKGDTVADVPTLTVFRPTIPSISSAAVVIAPGGGYMALSLALEGSQPAEWFSSRGITAFVLTYRVAGAARLPTVLEDGARSIRFVRANASAFGIDPHRIGMMGFSAGGHLAASTAIYQTGGVPDAADRVERFSSRPDFLVLGYPWLEATKVLADGSSQYCTFAAQAEIPCRPTDYAEFMPVRHVSGREPPTFIYHTSPDSLVSIDGSLRFATALHDKGVPVEIHGFDHGDHGTGLGGPDAALSAWTLLLENWLRFHGFLGSK